MFEMDAFTGVECLGLQFMKGEQPHAGFPEAAYFTMAEKLARAGHRVVVVEQVLPQSTSVPLVVKCAVAHVLGSCNGVPLLAMLFCGPLCVSSVESGIVSCSARLCSGTFNSP